MLSRAEMIEASRFGIRREEAISAALELRMQATFHLVMALDERQRTRAYE